MLILIGILVKIYIKEHYGLLYIVLCFTGQLMVPSTNQNQYKQAFIFVIHFFVSLSNYWYLVPTKINNKEKQILLYTV